GGKKSRPSMPPASTPRAATTATTAGTPDARAAPAGAAAADPGPPACEDSTTLPARIPRPTVPAEPTPGRRACSPAADPGGLMALKEIIPLVFLDIAIVVVAARLMGRLFRRLRQPAVVGEIVPGVVLGPCLLGLRPADL